MEVGSGAFRRTARTEEEERSQILHSCQSCAAPGERQAAVVVFGRKDGEREGVRLEGRQTRASLLGLSAGFCLFLVRVACVER